jgi:type I restriction enzyme S subunit
MVSRVPTPRGDWPVKPLGDLLTFLTSGSRGWAKHYSDSGSLFLRIQNVGRNKMLLDDVAFVSSPDTAEARRTLVQPGDVLLSITADLGRTGVVPEGLGTAYINQHLAILRVAGVHPPFLSAYLASPEGQKQIFGRNRAAVKAGLNFEDVRSFLIPIPPLAEQRRIAEVLDQAAALRAKRRAALAELDTLTQAIFLDIFGDPVTNPRCFPRTQLTCLVRENDSINYGVVQPGDDLDEGVPLVRVSDLLDGKVSHTALKRIAPLIESAYKRSRLRGDEILVSCVGSVGVVALADESVKGFNIARAVARIPLAEATERVFLAAYLKTGFVQRYFTNELRTVSQPTLNIKQLSETVVVLPPTELQRDFARRIANVEKLKAAHRASLAELDVLFASIQHRAFRGEL